VAVALTVRVLYVLSIRHAYFFDHLQDEPLRYYEWATLILDAPVPPGPPFDQAPGYAYLVAAVYRLFGRGVAQVAFVQAALGALACGLLAVIGDRLFGRRVGWIAGVLAAVYGPMIYFVGAVEPTIAFLFAALLATAAALLMRSRRGTERPPRDGAWLVAAGLWSVALLVRAEAVLAFPFVVLDAWMRGGRRAFWRTVLPLAAVLVTIAAVNVARSGQFVLLTTSGGLNLWLGNNPAADGVNCFVFGPVETVFTDVTAHNPDPAAADAEFRRRTWEFFRTEPRRAVALLGKKLLWTFNDRELPNTGDIEWQTAHSWLFRAPIVLPGFGFVLPLALAGGLVLGREWRKSVPLAALLAIGIGTPLVLFTNARFRMPMVPALVVLAAVALDRLPGMARAWRRDAVRVLAAAVAAIVGIVLAWNDHDGVRGYRIPQLTVNTGILERGAGDLDAAVRDLRAGLAVTPDDGLAWTHLALALEQRGEQPAALDAYLDGLAAAPRDLTLAETAVGFLRRHGIDPSALGAYRQATTDAERRAAASLLKRALPGASG
jgi:4-amino-4-deoxy-L-arabinose transferase-like glycosyltransferase